MFVTFIDQFILFLAPIPYDNFYNPTIPTMTATTTTSTTHIPQKDLPLPPLPTEALGTPMDCEYNHHT